MLVDRVFKGSLKDAAFAFEVTVKFLKVLISGGIDISDEMLKKIADKCGTTPRDILGNSFRHFAPILEQDKKSQLERKEALASEEISDNVPDLQNQVRELRGKVDFLTTQPSTLPSRTEEMLLELIKSYRKSEEECHEKLNEVMVELGVLRERVAQQECELAILKSRPPSEPDKSPSEPRKSGPTNTVLSDYHG